jgi:hypothetical protein
LIFGVFMNTSPRAAVSEGAFSVWLLRSSSLENPRFTIRFEVMLGMGALRLDQVGAVTPTLRRSQLGGLAADQLRKGRFMHFVPRDRMILQEYRLWAAMGEPGDLVVGKWIRMAARDGGLAPVGWPVAAPLPAAEDITDLSVGRGGLGAAMAVIKERRKQRSTQLIGFAPPAGLVRHLRRTIDRQQQEIDELKRKVAVLSGQGCVEKMT